MEKETFFQSVLSRPGSLVLPGNRLYVESLKLAGGKVVTQPSGHMVFYGIGDQRFLMTDPDGSPLHECEWEHGSERGLRLKAARLHLDWGQWVGLKPEGLINRTVLDLSTRPGWQSLTRDDLRMMAARAMNVSLEQIKFFYSDDDVVLDPQSGKATICQRKDAFYVLQDGRFEEARFMSCMSAMRWEQLDYLPVVELFLSLLPGTGSATFEFIRGLYDDQNSAEPVQLSYRGIPPYPSEGAFHLFSQFFTPSVRGSENAFSVFLDSSRSHEVLWLPASEVPLRYFEPSRKLCVTVKKGNIQKATISDDSTGLSFFAPNAQGFAPYGRRVGIQGNELSLDDGQKQLNIPIQSSWRITPSPLSNSPTALSTWHTFFPDGLPTIEPHQAFSAVLLYPEDDTPIGEKESQPFVFDYLDDLGENDPVLLRRISLTNEVLIYNCDAVLTPCVKVDKPRNYSVLFSSPPFAQKHAQLLWNQLARMKRLAWSSKIRLLPMTQYAQACLQQQYDMVYWWIAFNDFTNIPNLEQSVHSLSQILNPGGIGFLAGPPSVGAFVQRFPLDILSTEQALVLPTFRLHQAILPRAQLNPDLHIFVLQKQ